MKAFFSPSFATKLSIYVLSFTLIVFVCIMMLFYNYSRKQITEDAIDHAHGLLRNTATQISGELQIVEVYPEFSLALFWSMALLLSFLPAVIIEQHHDADKNYQRERHGT